MSLLDDIINGATDDGVSTANLLRKVQIVAHRLGSTELQEWVRRELNGYEDPDSLPPYRVLEGQVAGIYSGILYKELPQALGPGQIPEEAAEILFKTKLVASISELEELLDAPGDRELGVPWNVQQIAMYNRWAEEGLVPRINGHQLRSANRAVTRGSIKSVIDGARNTALGFALDLQATAPDAGSTEGPTMAELPVAHVVNNYFSNHIAGDAQVAQGHDIRQKMVVKKGDLAGLLAAARELGLGQEGAQELARVVVAEPQERPARMKRFLDAVRSGTFAIGTGITADVAASQLTELINAYMG